MKAIIYGSKVVTITGNISAAQVIDTLVYKGFAASICEDIEVTEDSITYYDTANREYVTHKIVDLNIVHLSEIHNVLELDYFIKKFVGVCPRKFTEEGLKLLHHSIMTQNMSEAEKVKILNNPEYLCNRFTEYPDCHAAAKDLELELRINTEEEILYILKKIGMYMQGRESFIVGMY